MRLVDAEGRQLGVIGISEALRMAAESGLDLVEVAPQAAPPVCRIMDFGKYKYQISKKQSQKKTLGVKEIKIRMRIDSNDLQRKVNDIRKFLDEGNKAKVTMYFRGREIVRPELGMNVFTKLTGMLTGKFQVEQPARQEGNHITMVLGPK